MELIYKLRRLSMAGTILHLGAHPDDEDVGLMAYAARKLGVRIVYWSATRGEGGQNRIGPEKAEALGVYRTWESLAARAADGGEALFGPFYDFGFSKSGEETFSKWGGRASVVREIVRAIRLVQPHVVIGRWTGQASDGHGHHQAVGQATPEAFAAAGDPARFPELQTQGLAVWQPQKLYFSTGGDWQPGEAGGVFGAVQPEFEGAGFVRIDTGEYDPIAGQTYQEQAWRGFNHHQSQAMGFVPAKGRFYYYFSLAKSLVPVPAKESNFYEGLDSSLTGLADYPGHCSTTLREKLAAVTDRAGAALVRFRAEEPTQADAPLLEGVSLLRELLVGLSGEDLPQGARQALDLYLERKLADFEATAAQCLGLQMECLAEYARITPGQQFQVTARLWNYRDMPLKRANFTFAVPEGWQIQPVDREGTSEKPTRPEAVYDITTPATAELSCSYWLVKPQESYRYHWPESEPASQPFNPPLVELRCEVILNSHRLTLREPAIVREGFPGGFRELPLAIVPPISLHPKIMREFLPVSASAQRLELVAVARSNMEWSGVEGSLKLEVPSGWLVEPEQVHLILGQIGNSRTVRFAVTIPPHTPAGLYPLRYVVQCGEREYGVILNSVRLGAPGIPRLPDEATCVKEELFTVPAVGNIHLIAVKFVRGLTYAYIKGAEEELLQALTHFDQSFHLIADEEMGYIDLGQFDAIVVGPNAYLVRDELRKNAARFLKYVEQGGTLIVQYQGYGYQRNSFVPYPFQFNQPHNRVTSERAPVTLQEPDHFLFNQPNVISAADFEGWVHDRGLYFFGRWDKRYQPLLACNDPGEAPQQGGLLLANYGRGAYIYTGYSFFKQLSAGVAGAFRLWANILAAPAARILERAEFLKQVSLFASLEEEQLQLVARIMSERWETDGGYLCHQGDEGDEMYILMQGEVKIIKESGQEQRVIYLAKRGEAIGELQVLSNNPRAATMQARGDVHLLVLEGSQFRSLMHHYPDITDRVIQMLVQRLATAGG